MKRFISDNPNVAEFYKIFVIIFANLLDYCQYKIYIEEYNRLLKYSSIIKVLNDLRKININEQYNEYTNAFIFIEKTLLQISVMNMIFNKYII